jgi:hypothetical protein
VSDDATLFPAILITDPSGFPLQFSVQTVECASQGYVVVQVLDYYGYELEFTETGIRPGELEDTPGDWLMELSVIGVRAVLDRLTILNALDSGDSLADTLDLSRISIVSSILRCQLKHSETRSPPFFGKTCFKVGEVWGDGYLSGVPHTRLP